MVIPVCDRVGDLPGGAGEGEVPASTAEAADEFAYGEPLAPGEVDHEGAAW